MRSGPVVALLGLLFGACALSAPPADETLSSASGIDALAQDALNAARAAPSDAAAQMFATERLFQAADLRLQQATVAWLDLHRDADRATVLAAEDRLGDDVRAGIVSLCNEGLACAERAVNTRPDDAAARLHEGLHVSLLAWANGPARSLMAGYGGRLVKAIDAAIAANAALDGGAPLRLQGRFRSKAPWPYGDVAAGTRALARAVALRSVPVNHLFYGDALAAAGDTGAAEEQWRLCIGAPADDSTRWSADLLRELARRRLAAKP
ncbi:MAG: hypothetical protein JNK78_09400 [Planctomycetes bacterium]|nr:hypothetical protein [Planctomycetota bacterium]